MKIRTHLKAGINTAELVNDAENTVSSAAQGVAHTAQGLAQSASNLAYSLGIPQTVSKLLFWPFNPPHN